jgi:hypothetical protein
MARLAQRLERAGPELFDIAAMRLDVVADKPRGIAFNPPADLAPEQIARQHRPSERLPSSCLVQLSRFGISQPPAVEGSLICRSGQSLRSGSEPWLQRLKSAHRSRQRILRDRLQSIDARKDL